ncbi:uncharacterized protein LOC130997339 isoform X1 [Salvia miltiorrhiza]|uniref:uncharacterized protein LOC130997339 isoform X1 n=1 Tax=Salvia miltiorrhiza TaxID=226208 RepID=UPI0025AB826F|nr:uncharacterized protein LOC130997339 isoform X1 [Salvia miltiorrhiza]
MPVMEKLRMFVVQEPVVAASCLIAGVGLFLPAVVRPILDSYGTSNEAPKTCMSDVSEFVALGAFTSVLCAVGFQHEYWQRHSAASMIFFH